MFAEEIEFMQGDEPKGQRPAADAYDDDMPF